jgi:acylaminoacyl-peptidase
VSDIPDWTYTEAWGTEEAKNRAGACPSAEDIARFHAVSPMSHVDKVGA